MLIFLLFVFASKISVNQASDEMLHSPKQPTPKPNQSKDFLVLDEKGRYSILHTKTLHDKGDNVSASDATNQAKSDYNEDWLDPSSLGTGKKLEISGCGGSVNLVCSGGSLAIHKVCNFIKTRKSC